MAGRGQEDLFMPRAKPEPGPACDPRLWPLNPELVFLNHGSFGSCPRAVLDHQRTLRTSLESDPIQFLARDLEGLLDQARASLAAFVGAEPDDLVFVSNATAGVNTVLRSLRFERGDELLVTNHEYNACRNALDFAAERSGARTIVAEIPFPCPGAEDIVESIVSRISSRTRLALIDHVTSQTGLVFPVAAIAGELAARGIDVLIDGAHAPGMVPLDLRSLGAAYYTGNCHKWLCAPKGAGFLVVRRDRQAAIRPLVISHGANSPRTDRSRYRLEFDWTGTVDPTAWLCVPKALSYVGSLLPGGWPAILARNHELALAGRDLLCEALGVPAPCPDDLVGSLAAVPLPDAASDELPSSPLYADPLQDELRASYAIEVPIIPWPAPPRRLLRIAAQLYNRVGQYELLAAALRRLLGPAGP
jgi:isopenicillin-N epimerase